mmetsp:Transcript_112843/g.240845  ORF Transcript_112843/g.240845 Transcript_112843/m.240845 type:complete len:241 (-) Transcript_112843:376-1098(-)
MQPLRASPMDASEIPGDRKPDSCRSAAGPPEPWNSLGLTLDCAGPGPERLKAVVLRSGPSASAKPASPRPWQVVVTMRRSPARRSKRSSSTISLPSTEKRFSNNNAPAASPFSDASSAPSAGSQRATPRKEPPRRCSPWKGLPTSKLTVVSSRARPANDVEVETDTFPEWTWMQSVLSAFLTMKWKASGTLKALSRASIPSVSALLQVPASSEPRASWRSSSSALPPLPFSTPCTSCASS